MMIVRRLFPNIRHNFTFKIFIIVITFIALMSATFTAFFIRYQQKSLEDGIISEGYAYSRLLANSSRLGVISENGKFLEDTVEGLLRSGEVSAASVLTRGGKVLIRKERAPGRTAGSAGMAGMIERARRSREPIYSRGADAFEFWAPVLTRSSSDDALFFEDRAHGREEVIGFVNVVLDVSPLRAELRAIIIRGVLAGLFFLLFGSVTAFIIAGKVTRPLNRLTLAVRSVASGGFAEDVPVETTDEIGRLAQSFNEMIVNLKKRETENFLLEAQLRQSQKMEAVGQLAGGVAHEINNPMNSIINLAQLILDESGTPGKSKQACAERIIREGGRISNIVKNLLAFSRKSIDEKGRVNVRDILSETMDLIAAQLKKDDIRLVISAPEGLPEIIANTQQIEQVFLNIIGNARYALNKKYPDGHENKVLKIHCEEIREDSRSYVRIVFRDHGTGIPANLIEKVANPFFTTKPAGEGTGLGLSISYGIINEHSGRLGLSSKEGEHTTVEICLPAAGRAT